MIIHIDDDTILYYRLTHVVNDFYSNFNYTAKYPLRSSVYIASLYILIVLNYNNILIKFHGIL